MSTPTTTTKTQVRSDIKTLRFWLRHYEAAITSGDAALLDEYAGYVNGYAAMLADYADEVSAR